ncbi:flagellar basal-body rod modification protein FlgD [Pseudoalteromonas ulvae UL12]|uniref:flagellar hook assembly protein FlgD n=1 Tax=Pseudoalteromonas ulvae TaxID=107327 RepID=UPI00186B880B|nr:flagellar hook assembly protein FlgD [Pseudoalteromonas ulvae]MBE0363752.1 flagellar basal-body rod modification protein FlgD [Pseudoalteromonas ulvae UL12]
MFNPINGSQSSSFVDSLKNTKEEKIQTAEEANELSQQDFFTLMTKQLSMQDPMNPTDNEAMMAQMTNMSIAEGVSNMATKFDQFAASMTSNQALQASSLVGRDVLIDTHYVHNTPGEEVSGRIALEQGASDIKVRIEDERGVVVGEIPLPASTGGNLEFKWDGKDSKGNTVPEGMYKIRAVGLVQNVPDENGVLKARHIELPVQARSRVDSVSMGQNGTGLVLNFNGLGSVKFEDVLEVS